MRKRNHHPFIIAVDIDETILRSFDVLIAHLNQTHQTTHEREELTEHDWEGIENLRWSQKQIDDGWDTLFRDPTRINQIHHLIDGAHEGVQALVSMGAKVIAVTGRGRRAHRSTRHLIDTFFPGLFSSVYYVDYRHSSLINKGELARQHRVKVAIDDNPNFLKEFEHEDIDTYGLTTPWNKDTKREGLKTKFFDSWRDIVKDIESTYSLELSRLHRSHAVLVPDKHELQDISHKETHLINLSDKEMHLSVIEPHSHDIIRVAPHEHDLALLTKDHAITLVDQKQQQITVVTPDTSPSTPQDTNGETSATPIKPKRRRTTTPKKPEVAAE